MLKVPWHFHEASCSLEGLLEFNGSIRKCFRKFLTVSQRGVGRVGGKKGKGLTGRVDPKDHIYSWPLRGITDLYWTAEYVQFHGILAAPYRSFTDDNRPHALTQPFLS